MSEFESNGKEVRAAVRKGLRRNVLSAILVYERGLKLTLQGQRTGRVYTIPRSKATYTASAPGEAPARRTGDLAGSVDHALESDTSGVAGTPLDRGLYLDRGTRRIAPRPWIRPGFRLVIKSITAALSRPIE